MPVIFKQEKQCALCGCHSPQTHARKMRTYGSLDLDLRPPEEYRSMLSCSIEYCPNCGYVADDISAYTNLSLGFLSDETYLTCCSSELSGEWPIKFFKQALIALETCDEMTAFHALLHAAWACDDNHDALGARKCRRRALAIANGLLSDPLYYSDPLAVIRIDLLRRIRQFDTVQQECPDMLFPNIALNSIIQFQMEKARHGDSACYTINDAIVYARRIDK
ncbi:hypothetical protein SDC9_121206 [bioreactor metagenome]|uniref:DUF2225 domain-containing protein n=1 Tax=bioreactor metagenome TaxID=1076179 RepID=A0A645CBB5_9ZZZZ